MIYHKPFEYSPSHTEREKAAYSYVMSILAIIAGLPLPIVNLLATVIFYLGNRKSTYFVRWHCTQALFAQILLFVINMIGVSWLLIIIFGDASFTNAFIAYLAMMLLVNLVELIMTIYSAIQVNRGEHVEWWIFGELTNSFCKRGEATRHTAS